MADVGFIPQALWLGAELREAREAAGLGVRELAKKLGMSNHTRISLWELAKRVPSVDEVERILGALDVAEGERVRILGLAREASQPSWLTAGIPGVPDHLGALMEIERRAKKITTWSPLIVPGLLQTGDVARAIMADSPTADTSVAMRLGRRDILTRRGPVEFVAVISEAALREPLADPDVMAAQLRDLVTTAGLPNVAIQVVPAGTRGWHGGRLGPFALIEFDRARPIVYREHHRASDFVSDENDVADYMLLGERLRQLALGPEESVKLIEQIAKEVR